MNAREVQERLAAPFPPDVIEWKPQSVSGNRALAIAYVDARAVIDRLNDVMGLDGWQDAYELLSDGCAVCRLSLKVGEAGTWVTRWDVGGESDQKDEGDRRKASFSDALKRAAVKFGVGRYLYKLPGSWVDYDPQKKRFTREPALPAWALPRTAVPARTEARREPASAEPEAPDPAEVVGREQVITLSRLIGETGSSFDRFCKHFGIATIEELPQAAYATAMEMLSQKRKTAKVTA